MDTVTVKFPLKGEWVAANTPAEKIPSHGTDLWGQTYAYDFLRIMWRQKGFKFFSPSMMKYWLTGVTLDECLGYGETIYAPFSGTIIESHDQFTERQRLHPALDILRVIKNSLTFIPKKGNGNAGLIPMLGNYIILKDHEKELYAMLAHLRPNSLRITTNDTVTTGQELAQVGHTGNSTAPHLHFQLMDNMDIQSAKGIACAFHGYEHFDNDAWNPVSEGTPEKRQLIRDLT